MPKAVFSSGNPFLTENVNSTNNGWISCQPQDGILLLNQRAVVYIAKKKVLVITKVRLHNKCTSVCFGFFKNGEKQTNKTVLGKLLSKTEQRFW